MDGLTFLVGGARSGKSATALKMASRWKGAVTFIATAEARDDEMAERIARHRRDRPREWNTLEEPIELETAIASVSTEACVMIDCLTLWVSNLMERGLADEEIDRRGREAAALAAEREGPTIAVSNEVGSGIVPVNPLARRYQDLLGGVNVAWADAAARAMLVVAGKTLPLDGSV